MIHITVPSLSERTGDIRLLVNHFIEKYGKDEGKEKIDLTPETWKALYGYSWPGNVRELENIIERAVVLNSDGLIEPDDLPPEFSAKESELNVEKFIPHDAPLQKTLEEIEEKMIKRALAQCNNVQAHAAEQLRITKSLIQHKMKKYNIQI